MKSNFTKFTNLALGVFVLVLLASCYKFGRIAAPKEVAGAEPYQGRILVVNDGNNGSQYGLSFFAVRVPENWNVTVGDDSYKQFAREDVVNDSGEIVNQNFPMRYSANLASRLNETNPKEGYTWFAFQTVDCICRNIMGSDSHGADSIAFDYTVTNDGVAGDYELDYMIGSYQTDDPNYLENNTSKSTWDMMGDDIYRVSTEEVLIDHDDSHHFKSVYPEFKTTVKVLEGAVVTDNSPSLSVDVKGTTATVNYKNLSGGISVYKGAATLAHPLDYTIEGLQKYNTGSYDLDITKLEPGTYHVRSLTTDTETTFEVAPYDYTKAETSLMVIGGTKYLAPELLVDENDVFQAATATEAGLFKTAPVILQKMVEKVAEVKPTALLVTGNLTLNGAKVSHEQMATFLKQVTDLGVKAYVVPGSNDINNYEACKYEGEGATAVEYISAEDFANIYAGCGYNEAVMRDATTLSYLAYPSKDLAVLAIDACQYANNTVATTEDGLEVDLDASGVITGETLEWIAEAALTAHKTGRQVIVMMNHLVMSPFNGYASLGNVVNNNEQVDISTMFGGSSTEETEAAKRKAEDLEYVTAEIQNALTEAGVSAVFVGGLNANDIQKVETANGEDLYQIVTGEAISYTLPYRLVNFEGNKLDIQTYGLNNVEIEGLGMSFEDYAYYRTKNMIPVLVSTVIEQNWDMINGILQSSFTFDYDPEVDIFNKNDFFKLPETPEAFAELVNTNVVPPFVNTMLTFVDGNENYKQSQVLVDDMHAGWDNFISGLNTYPAVINPMVKEGFADAGLDVDGMIDAIVPSIAYNYLNTEDNVSNDLFITIPVTYDVTVGINHASDANTGNVQYYTVGGVQVQNTNAHGIYIKKMADGKTTTIVK